MKKLLSILFSLGLLSVFATAANATTLDIAKPTSVSVDNLGTAISGIIGILIVIAAIAAFVFLILGGIQWITSGGDKAGMESARNKITSAVVGLIIVAAAWAIMALLGKFIGFDILSGSTPIPTLMNPAG